MHNIIPTIPFDDLSHGGVTTNFTVIRHATGEVEHYQAKNALASRFTKAGIPNQSNYIKAVWVGTGTTAPAATDTTLEELLYKKDINLRFNSRHILSKTSDGQIVCLQGNGYGASMGLGAIITTDKGISEIGMRMAEVWPDSNTTQIHSRSLIRDINGDLTTIHLGATDELLINEYEMRLKIQGFDQTWTNKVNLDGVEQDVTFSFINRNFFIEQRGLEPGSWPRKFDTNFRLGPDLGYGTTSVYARSYVYLAKDVTIDSDTHRGLTATLQAISGDGTALQFRGDGASYVSSSTQTMATGLGGAEGTWTHIVLSAAIGNGTHSPMAIGQLASPITLTSLQTIEAQHQYPITGISREPDEDFEALPLPVPTIVSGTAPLPTEITPTGDGTWDFDTFIGDFELDIPNGTYALQMYHYAALDDPDQYDGYFGVGTAKGATDILPRQHTRGSWHAVVTITSGKLWIQGSTYWHVG